MPESSVWVYGFEVYDIPVDSEWYTVRIVIYANHHDALTWILLLVGVLIFHQDAVFSDRFYYVVERDSAGGGKRLILRFAEPVLHTI